tara:strand:- start:220 stop:390 length:171 start_codon:yes stop_codon:yes gene_type:complete
MHQAGELVVRRRLFWYWLWNWWLRPSFSFFGVFLRRFLLASFVFPFKPLTLFLGVG